MATQIDLTNLNPQQLEELHRNFTQEFEYLSSQVSNLKLARTKMVHASEAVEDMKSKESGHEILVPLTSSLYVPGQLEDTKTVLVDVGTGFYVKYSNEDALSHLERKSEKIAGEIEKVMQALTEMQRNLQLVQDVRQQRMEQMQAQARAAGGSPAGV